MKTTRLYGLDLLRSLCILIIVYYHSWETVFGDAKVFLSPVDSSYGLLSQGLAVFLSLGGLGIVFLSFFLIGRSSRILTPLRFILIVGGLLAITPPDENGRLSFENIQWSVYSYLFISYLLVSLISKIPKSEYLFAILGSLLIMTRTDFWIELIGPLSENWSYIIYGQFGNDYVGWSLLPWLGLPLFSWSIGKISIRYETSLHAFKKSELALWLLSIGAVYISSTTITEYPISRAPFYDHVFNMPALNFWLRLLIFVFLLRISLTQKISQSLKNIKIVRLNSQLAWNKHFGFCYLTEFIFLPMGVPYKQYFVDHPRLFDFYWVFILVATELTIRLVFYFVNLAKRGK